MDRIVKFLRYRFFLFAGIFPYLIGQFIAYKDLGYSNIKYFLLGLFSLFFVLISVEIFNEYFDGKEGGDRIFDLEKREIPDYIYFFGLYLLLFPFFFTLYFTFTVRPLLFIFSILGFIFLYFYVGPPIKFAYKGVGELVIGISYGPLMIFGSYYLQTGRFSKNLIYPSIIVFLLLLYIAILNEIPDYYQDYLVGKKNIVVRIGKRRAITFLNFLIIMLFLSTLLFKLKNHFLSLLALLILIFNFLNLKKTVDNIENPKIFLPLINTGIITYLFFSILILFSYGDKR